MSDWTSPLDFLEKLAKKSGKLLKGGEPDLKAVSKVSREKCYCGYPQRVDPEALTKY